MATFAHSRRLSSDETQDADVLGPRVLAGDVRAAARLITLLEDEDPGARAALARLFPETGKARVVGVTGPPGAGKSTLVNRLITEYRASGLTVGVIAVDPSSPFSGGALLGDRVRMRSHSEDKGVIIRSMAARRKLGGIALATPAAVRVLDAFGCDRIIVETVGVGQGEVAVAAAADCTVLVLVPGLGDSVQAMKAGVMEIADIFVVNKADREGASQTRQHLVDVLQARPHATALPPVLLCSAESGKGVAEVANAVEELLVERERSGSMEEARCRQLEDESHTLLALEARRRILHELDDVFVGQLMDGLRSRQLDPVAVVDRILARWDSNT